MEPEGDRASTYASIRPSGDAAALVESEAPATGTSSAAAGSGIHPSGDAPVSAAVEKDPNKHYTPEGKENEDFWDLSAPKFSLSQEQVLHESLAKQADNACDINAGSLYAILSISTVFFLNSHTRLDFTEEHVNGCDMLCAYIVFDTIRCSINENEVRVWQAKCGTPPQFSITILQSRINFRIRIGLTHPKNKQLCIDAHEFRFMGWKGGDNICYTKFNPALKAFDSPAAEYVLVQSLDPSPLSCCQHGDQFWVCALSLQAPNGVPLYTPHEYATTQEHNNWIYACWNAGEPSIIAHDNMDCGHEINDCHEPSVTELAKFANAFPDVYRHIRF